MKILFFCIKPVQGFVKEFYQDIHIIVFDIGLVGVKNSLLHGVVFWFEMSVLQTKPMLMIYDS